MFKNYFRIASRNLIRNKSFTIINIAGLAAGIAVCMMIFIVIRFHTSFDNFHPEHYRIYRVLTEYHNADASTTAYGKDVPFPLPAALKLAFPQIEQIAPVWASHNDQLLIPDGKGSTIKTFKEDKGVFFTTPSFFRMFNYPLLAGSYESLKNPNNVLLSQETAEKYFGDWRSATGKTIKLEAGGHIFSHGVDVLTVSGVLASFPSNTDFQMKMVVSFGTGITEDMAKNTDWSDKSNADFGCFIKMPKEISLEHFNQQMKGFSKKIASPGNEDLYIIQPLGAVHHDSQAGNYSNRTISRELLNVLWLIAAFILLIACVNFINLSTAQAVNRAKEVGVRKVLGSNKTRLQIQFIAETFMIVIAAVLISAAIGLLAIPYLNRILDLSLPFGIVGSPPIILFLLIISLIVTVLAGFYPSVVLSRFNPVQVLKTRPTASTTKGISLRRALVVFQFIIAQALIIGTFIIIKQMNFFMTQPLGFDKDAIINIPFRVDSLRLSRLDFLKDKLMAISGVQEVSFSSNTPVEDGNDMWSTLKFDHATTDADFKAITKFADTGFVSTYRLPLVAGRNLQSSSWTKEFLVNESMLRNLGIRRPEDILNKEISIWGGLIKCPVVGVLKDFNDRSFKHELAPLIITTNETMYSQAGIKLETKNISSTLESVKLIFEQTFPNFVYEYRFLDDKIAGFYKQENQLAQLYRIFAAISILLSCLGLYGLASFMAVQRTKEVGIRKVLGASAGHIVYLFSKEFMLLISLAFIIATPLAWYFMHQWLQNYVYRVSIGWWAFAAGGLASVMIALATISFRAIKAAAANPVRSLRTE